MSEFVAEEENKYITYFILKPRNGIGCLVSGFNGQQAIAKMARYYSRGYQSIVCVRTI